VKVKNVKALSPLSHGGLPGKRAFYLMSAALEEHQAFGLI